MLTIENLILGIFPNMRELALYIKEKEGFNVEETPNSYIIKRGYQTRNPSYGKTFTKEGAIVDYIECYYIKNSIYKVFKIERV